MRYNRILFDADDTLFDFKKSEREAFKNTMIHFHVDYNEEYHLPIYHNINSAIWREFEEGLITQEVLKVERFRRLSKELNIQFDVAAFSDSYMEHLGGASFLYEDSLALIQSLHKNYKLSIVTNGLTKVQRKRIRQSEIAEYFEYIVISEEVKVSKPDPKIFEYAVTTAESMDKSSILMVGDSLTSDIQGGINFGIDTCWFNQNKKENRAAIWPTYEITRLAELKDLL
ncbi:MAG: superfamily [Lachnospiraceae bacterium]|jgi:putative hydrolase of the HAD superfamily|nr:superfamily [Lachnospiraceae bacterium]